MNILVKLKSYLMSAYTNEMDVLRRENLRHLIYCIDELILGKARVSKDEILNDFEVYSDYMLEVRMVYLMLKGYLNKEKVNE